MSSFPTPQLLVDIETLPDAVEVVRARGAVDLLTGPDLERSIETALEKQPTAIIVDFTDVDFLASFGMSILLRTKERVGADTHLVIVADGPATSRPMSILGLTDVLTICSSLDAALEHLRQSR
jgi:anti-sigma B factor antagonist